MLSKTVYRKYKTLLDEKHDDNVGGKSKINGFIKGAIVISVVIAAASSLVSYTLVLSQEKALQSLHSETMVTQMDNIDIKNDVEFTRSLYNVHGKAKTLTFLHKPDKIIEVDMINDSLNVDINTDNTFTVDRIVTGY